MTAETQRRLILIRHAKAVEEDAGGDHTRALSPRGREDAAMLGAWLTEQGLQPDQVLCSTATRTRETLAAFKADYPTSFCDRLYLAELGELTNKIHNTDDSINRLMIIGHNPGMHGLLARLAGDYVNRADESRVVMKFPTAACAVLRFNVGHWSELAPHSGILEQLRWSVDH